jgi:hypothetical protein
VKIGIESNGGGKGCRNTESAIPFSFIVQTTTYATGNAITLPSERYVIGGDVYTQFTSRNGYRMDPYHRMDIGATYTPSKKKKRFKSTWNFSIYNVYSRKNPYFIYFALEGLDENGENQNIQNGNVEPKAYQDLLVQNK